MALVSKDQGPQELTWRRRALRVAGSVVVTTALFVVATGAVAYATRDTATGVPRDLAADLAAFPAVRDAGPSADAGVADAGALDAGPDAGELVGVAPEPDAGPTIIASAPVDASAIAALVQPVARGCLEEALRFDPALGGAIEVELALGGEVEAKLLQRQVVSPLFARCLGARVEALALPTLETRERVRMRLVLDGLRTEVRIEGAELVVTP